MITKKLLALAVLAIVTVGGGCIGSARATTWFFSPSGSDSGAGTSAAPWLNPGNHNSAYLPGDILTVAAGTYSTMFGWALTASGSANGGYITLQCAPNQTSKVVVSTSNQNGILFTNGASYWDLRGCNVTATGANGSAIIISGKFSSPFGPLHHIIIEGNYAHDSSCEGIAVSGNTNILNNSSGTLVTAYATDYIIIRSNNVVNNGRTSALHCSGIAIYEPIALDAASGDHLVVQGNVVYNNFDCDSCGNVTDGHGILMDDFSMSQNSELASFAYNQSSLVSHNLSFNNGGKGIEAFASEDVLIDSNTAWGNNQDANECGLAFEIGSLKSTNITVTNNFAEGVIPTNCANSPIYAYAEYGSGSPTNDVFTSNTGIAASGMAYFVHTSPGFSFGSTNQ